MKTRYQKPVIEIILPDMQQDILAGSTGGILDPDPTAKSLNLNDAASTSATSGNLSRTGFWDDEE